MRGHCVKLGWQAAALAITFLAPNAAAAAELPAGYLVEEKPLKAAVAGTPLSFELYSDNTCTTLVDSVAVDVEDVTILSRLKQMTPQGDTKLPNTVELRTTLAGVTPGTATYLKVTDAGGAVVPVGGACQAQAGGGAAGPTGATGATGPTGPDGEPGDDASSIGTIFAATDQAVSNNDFVGVGQSSSVFAPNSIVAPFTGVVTNIVFSVRVPLPSSVTLTLYSTSAPNVISPLNGSSATVGSCTVLSGFTWCSASTSVPIVEGDLLSGRVSTGGGALSNGVTWSAVLSPL